MARLTVKLHSGEAMRCNRVALVTDRLVYVLVADKPIRYPGGSSRIAYIGTTSKGAGRVAGSLAHRAYAILERHGVRGFAARIVTCRRRRNVQTWRQLERAMLLHFRDAFDAVPICNVHGGKIRERGEFSLFSRTRVANIVQDLSARDS